MSDLGVRWTVGDVSRRGFEALRLSIWGASRVFGARARLAVCVNTIPVGLAQERTGELPEGVIWHDATRDAPAFLRGAFDETMAEGVGWKLAPMRFFHGIKELSLDNDAILWDMPEAIQRWLATDDDTTCVVAEDVVPLFGQFADLCGTEPRNGGIRGLPPGFDLEAAMKDVLCERPVVLRSELDEQGLQTAAIRRRGRPLVVTVPEVTICSPFPPHLPSLGTCGAHFCGLNAKSLPWELGGRPATHHVERHWARLEPEVRARVLGATATSRGVPEPGHGPPDPS